MALSVGPALRPIPVSIPSPFSYPLDGELLIETSKGIFARSAHRIFDVRDSAIELLCSSRTRFLSAGAYENVYSQ
jgi:hypothetical protein